LARAFGGWASRGYRKVVGSTDGNDFFDVMSAVNELEPAPMIDVKRAEDLVSGEWRGAAEDSLRFVADGVEAGELLGNAVDKVFA
jgi:hypothetical protein